MVCVNTTCCHKLQLVLIGKYKRPACFSNKTCPIKYSAQKSTWMDIPTCWNWFNEVFYADVHIITYHAALLLMDNAPRYFDPFQTENVVRLFTFNVTSWKQPCNLGVIAAVNKKYKFLLLKYVLSLCHVNINFVEDLLVFAMADL